MLFFSYSLKLFSIVLFNHQSFKILDLTYTTSENKIDITNKINSIRAGGGTIIISGLTTAIDILKIDQLKNKDNKDYKNRIPSIILLSDGNDNNMDDIQLSQSFKEITKNLNLFFTVHTFGYGSDHDPKIMTKLANKTESNNKFLSKKRKNSNNGNKSNKKSEKSNKKYSEKKEKYYSDEESDTDNYLEDNQSTKQENQKIIRQESNKSNEFNKLKQSLQLILNNKIFKSMNNFEKKINSKLDKIKNRIDNVSEKILKYDKNKNKKSKEKNKKEI